jgi:hypothetical protein
VAGNPKSPLEPGDEIEARDLQRSAQYGLIEMQPALFPQISFGAAY